MNKKGQLIAVLIGVAVFIVLILVSGKLKDLIAGQSPIERCRMSVAASAISKQGGLPSGEPLIDIDCQRIKKEIKFSEVSTKNKIDHDRVNRAVAEQMYDCYYKTGQFTLDPFSDWDNAGVSYCIICSSISFDDEFKKHFADEVKKSREAANFSFYQYLYETVPPGQNKTFFELIARAKPNQTTLDAIKKIDENNTFYVNGNSYIVFNLLKEESKSSFWAKFWAGSGVAIGVVAAAASVFTGGLAGIAIMSVGVGLSAYTTSFAADTVVHAQNASRNLATAQIIFAPEELLFKREFINASSGQVIKDDNGAPMRLCSIVVN